MQKTDTTYPAVSVIIPNYNYAQYLDNRIQSVLNQTFQDFEIILLDDASTDSSSEIIEKYRNHPKVSCVDINTENTGSPFVQWEKGIGMARGKYIWIAEADDLADPDFLRHTVDAMEKNPEVSVAVSMSHLIDSNGNPSAHKPFEPFDENNTVNIYNGESYLSGRMLMQNSCYNASMILFRKDAFNAITDKTYLNMRYVGDWYFWVNLISGRQIAEIRKKLSYFRLHSGSTTRKGAITAIPQLESSITAFNILNRSKSVSPVLRRLTLYRIFRDFRKGKADISLYNPEMARQLDSMHVSSWQYTAYWLYKHIMKPFIKVEQPQPIRTYPLP